MNYGIWLAALSSLFLIQLGSFSSEAKTSGLPDGVSVEEEAEIVLKDFVSRYRRAKTTQGLVAEMDAILGRTHSKDLRRAVSELGDVPLPEISVEGVDTVRLSQGRYSTTFSIRAAEQRILVVNARRIELQKEMSFNEIREMVEAALPKFSMRSPIWSLLVPEAQAVAPVVLFGKLLAVSGSVLGAYWGVSAITDSCQSVREALEGLEAPLREMEAGLRRYTILKANPVQNRREIRALEREIARLDRQIREHMRLRNPNIEQRTSQADRVAERETAQTNLERLRRNCPRLDEGLTEIESNVRDAYQSARRTEDNVTTEVAANVCIDRSRGLNRDDWVTMRNQLRRMEAIARELCINLNRRDVRPAASPPTPGSSGRR